MVEKRFEIGVRVGANVYDGVLATRRRRAGAAASRRQGHRSFWASMQENAYRAVASTIEGVRTHATRRIHHFHRLVVIASGGEGGALFFLRCVALRIAFMNALELSPILRIRFREKERAWGTIVPISNALRFVVIASRMASIVYSANASAGLIDDFQRKRILCERIRILYYGEILSDPCRGIENFPGRELVFG